jgi:two-component system sensor histidine kinase HydH
MSARRGRVSVEYEPPPEPIILQADAAQIEDAVLNLIINAVEAVGTSGRVTVSLSRREPSQNEPNAEGYAIIEVEDTGRGISEEELQHIFSPFYTTSAQGTGLGLPAVSRIARAHGGRVEVSSSPGVGSTFKICLPIITRT